MLQLDATIRSEMKDRVRELQDDILHKTHAKRQSRRPQRWAFGFAGKPREFFGHIINEWNDDNWTAWRSFISTVFVQPFQTIGEHRVFQKCTALLEPPAERPPSVWMPVGRRGGKSRILAGIAVYLGCCYDFQPYLDPGELGVIPVLAADRRQARTIMSYVKAFLEHPQLRDLVVSESAESILLRGNILIEVVTASYRAVRSRTVLAALCDEIAFWHSEEASTNPDSEIIAALEPAMATIPNALLLGASSPYARRGVLWDRYERYWGKPGGPLIWRAPTRVMNPTITQAFINEKIEEDPISAAAEYGAEFRSDVDAFITREVLDLAVNRNAHEIPPQPGIRYFGFVDPSGGTSDAFTLAIGHVDRDTKRGVLDVLRERRPKFSPEGVSHEYAAMLRQYRVFRIAGDHYAGEWPKEQFRKHGVQYEISKRNKSEIYLEFLPLLNAGRVELLDERRLYNEFMGLERRTARGGHESIDHGPGMHDDLANVVAGVMVIMLGKRQTLSIDPGVLLKSATYVAPRHVDLINPRAGGPSGPVWR